MLCCSVLWARKLWSYPIPLFPFFLCLDHIISTRPRLPIDSNSAKFFFGLLRLQTQRPGPNVEDHNLKPHCLVITILMLLRITNPSQTPAVSDPHTLPYTVTLLYDTSRLVMRAITTAIYCPHCILVAEPIKAGHFKIPGPALCMEPGFFVVGAQNGSSTVLGNAIIWLTINRKLSTLPIGHCAPETRGL